MESFKSLPFHQIKTYPLFIALILLLGKCKTPSSSSKIAYFEAIAFPQSEPKLHKWEQDIHLFCQGEWPPELKFELEKIRRELISLTSLKITYSASAQDANLLIFLGSKQEYLRDIEPESAPYIGTNQGFFYLHLKEKVAIHRASIFLQQKHPKLNLNLKKHLLREELSQSLGLIRDSWDYPESIFYAGASKRQSYCPLDLWVIQLLYQPRFKSGMSLEKFREVYQDEVSGL